MAVVEIDPERYANPTDFAREVNLPLLGSARLRPVPSGAGLAQLLELSSGAEALAPVVERLTESRRSLTLRSLLVAGFAHDPECFAVGLAIAREWSRRGLRVAVVDLDFWNPTVSRPPSHPNEGLVDVLEYGCSFGRVAWEIVADKLWLIGPGSHPPDESRIVDHPDWARAGRVFGACVDVTIYTAPLLDRRGFTGQISKKMDAVVLAAATERIGRADLRDAFLELWASDAPMIGCVGIEPLEPPVSRHPVEAAAPAAVGAGVAGNSGAAAVADRPSPPASSARSGSGRASSAGPSWEPVRPEPPAWEREASVGAFANDVARAAGPASEPMSTPAPRPMRAPADRAVERELEAALERDVRRGVVEKKKSAKNNIGILVGSVLGLAVVAGGLTAILAKRPAPPSGSVQASQPAGEEPITPANGNPAAGSSGSPAAPSGLEQGNLDDPSAPTGAFSGSTPGEIGSVTALGKEIHTAQPPDAASPLASNSAPTPSAAPRSEPLRAGLAGGMGSLPGLSAPAGGSAADAAKPFRVHVASFRTESKVKEIVAGLRARKLDAWFEPPPPGGGWYRVFVGHFATEAEAATYAQWLVKSGAADRAESFPQTKR